MQAPEIWDAISILVDMPGEGGKAPIGEKENQSFYAALSKVLNEYGIRAGTRYGEKSKSKPAPVKILAPMTIKIRWDYENPGGEGRLASWKVRKDEGKVWVTISDRTQALVELKFLLTKEDLIDIYRRMLE